MLKRHVATVTWIVLLALIVGCKPTTIPAPLPTAHPECATSIPEDIKEMVRNQVEHEHNVGIVVGAITPCGTEYYSYGHLTASGDRPVDEDTVFEIGSVTKVFTTILLADMVERGEVSLDDPIEQYLPDNVKISTPNDRPIALAHLATHTSGLGTMPDSFTPADENNPWADFSVEKLYDTLANYPIRRNSGTRYEYSNLGMGLLGHILELQSEMTYEELVVERVANELGMPDTRISLPYKMRRRLATGHDESGPVANWDIRAVEGAGALRSTARDMLTFLAANVGLKESRLLPAMQTTHEPQHRAGSPNMHIGLGWHIRTNGDTEIVEHHGATGGYWSFVGFIEDEQTGVVVLTNSFQAVDEIGIRLL
jgi:CubicO group peptidase (beta-lactamase class C family)